MICYAFSMLVTKLEDNKYEMIFLQAMWIGHRSALLSQINILP